jgi:hypothetical protein
MTAHNILIADERRKPSKKYFYATLQTLNCCTVCSEEASPRLYTVKKGNDYYSVRTGKE